MRGLGGIDVRHRRARRDQLPAQAPEIGLDGVGLAAEGTAIFLKRDRVGTPQQQVLPFLDLFLEVDLRHAGGIRCRGIGEGGPGRGDLDIVHAGEAAPAAHPDDDRRGEQECTQGGKPGGDTETIEHIHGTDRAG
jgi:hypothetical protein